MYVSKEKANHRLSICKNCIHYIKQTDQCSLCGCFMSDKVHYKDAKCADTKAPRWKNEQ